jgi:hypothetical protein
MKKLSLIVAMLATTGVAFAAPTPIVPGVGSIVGPATVGINGSFSTEVFSRNIAVTGSQSAAITTGSGFSSSNFTATNTTTIGGVSTNVLGLGTRAVLNSTEFHSIGNSQGLVTTAGAGNAWGGAFESTTAHGLVRDNGVNTLSSPQVTLAVGQGTSYSLGAIDRNSDVNVSAKDGAVIGQAAGGQAHNIGESQLSSELTFVSSNLAASTFNQGSTEAWANGTNNGVGSGYGNADAGATQGGAAKASNFADITASTPFVGTSHQFLQSGSNLPAYQWAPGGGNVGSVSWSTASNANTGSSSNGNYTHSTTATTNDLAVSLAGSTVVVVSSESTTGTTDQGTAYGTTTGTGAGGFSTTRVGGSSTTGTGFVAAP